MQNILKNFIVIKWYDDLSVTEITNYDIKTYEECYFRMEGSVGLLLEYMDIIKECNLGFANAKEVSNKFIVTKNDKYYCWIQASDVFDAIKQFENLFNQINKER